MSRNARRSHPVSDQFAQWLMKRRRPFTCRLPTTRTVTAGLYRVRSAVITTNYARWTDASTTWGARNPSRAEYAAALIPPGSHVLDVGAGSMILREFLPAGCRYTPSDIHDRGDGCIVADLNRSEFPPGRYDVVTMVGVLEYVFDPRFALRCAARSASQVILTYNWFEADTAETLAVRQTRGWISHLTAPALEAEIFAAGLIITDVPMPHWYVTSSTSGS